MAAAVFTAVGVAAWLGPDIRVGLAKDTSGMWDFVRGGGDRSESPWHQGPEGFTPWHQSWQGSPFGYDEQPAQPAPARRAVRGSARKVPAVARGRGRTPTLASAAPASTPVQAGQAVCVRLCDGFFFPVGTIQKASDLPGQEAVCQSLCPGAPTHAYAVPAGADTIDKATSRDGRLYSALPVAFRHQHATDNTCTCHAPNEGLLLSLMHDVTLRRGDAVATADGVRVFGGASHWPYRSNDFLSLAAARGFEPKAAALSAIERSIKLPQAPGPALSLAAVKRPKPEVAATLLPEALGRRIRLIGLDKTPASRPKGG